MADIEVIDYDDERRSLAILMAIETEIVEQQCGERLPEPEGEHRWLMSDQLDVDKLAASVLAAIKRAEENKDHLAVQRSRPAPRGAD